LKFCLRKQLFHWYFPTRTKYLIHLCSIDPTFSLSNLGLAIFPLFVISPLSPPIPRLSRRVRPNNQPSKSVGELMAFGNACSAAFYGRVISHIIKQHSTHRRLISYIIIKQAEQDVMLLCYCCCSRATHAITIFSPNDQPTHP
jgi:hypothetical protein